MKIIEFFECKNKDYWLYKISESDWRTGKYLFELLKSNQFFLKFGTNAKVLMLVDDNNLLAFCTLSQKKYDINSELSPWLGCVYTFPEYRGNRYSEKLMQHAERIVCELGKDKLFVSTKHEELYEKYGYIYYGLMTDWRNEKQRVYYKIL